MTPRLLGRLAATALALTAGLALTGCGAKVDRITPNPAAVQTISLDLDGTPSAADVGIYLAQSDGAFAAADLKVDVHTAPSSSSAINPVAYNEANVGIASEPALMIQRDQTNLRGTVLGFGAIAQKPLAALISIGSAHISSFSDLRGKTLGVTTEPGQSELLTAALKAAGVAPGSVRRVVLGGSELVSAMTSKRVDATFGGTAAVVGAALRRKGDKPSIVPVTQTGVPTYDELVLVCTETYFANHTALLRRFVQALGRGYTAARANPTAAVRALQRAVPGVSTPVQTAAVTHTLPLLFPGQGKPWGWQFQKPWNTFGKWLVTQKILHHPAWYQASTNQLLAGVGP